jgi:O-antigen ligase
MMRLANATGPDGGMIAAIWLAFALSCGLAVGLAIPLALESALDIFGIALAALICIGVFAMPRQLTHSDRACWALFLTMLALFCLYPSYISLRISGLPWISPLRIVLAILLVAWLYALRVSPVMQPRLMAFIRANRFFFWMLAVFVATQALGIPTSRQPMQAATKFALFQLYWTFPLFAILSMVNTERRLQTFFTVFITFAAFQCAIGFVEARLERVLWLDYLPPGFAADSEVLQRILQGAFRAEGYRVQGTFSVSLLYAEFLVLMLPFALFAFLDRRSITIRAVGLITAIAIVPAQYLSGSRLGMVGSITVIILLGLLFVVRVWRADKRSMAGGFMVILAAAGLALFAAAFMSSPRLRVMTIGGGQHQASTDSRLEMWAMSPPRILERPLFGHGPGLGAETLGFTNPSGTLTIDSYWLSALLEFGLIGALALLAMISWAIWTGIRTYLDKSNPHRFVGGPAALALIAFLIIKTVLSQVDNHLLAFVLMALIILARTGLNPLAQSAEQAPALAPGRKRARKAALTPPKPIPVGHRKTASRMGAGSRQSDRQMLTDADRKTVKLHAGRRGAIHE